MRNLNSFFKPAYAFCALVLPFVMATAASHAEDVGTTQPKIDAAKWCMAKGATSPEAFAFCTSGFLSDEDILKCVADKSCFGTNLAAMTGFSACSSPKVMRVFGAAAGCGAKKCTGNPGRFYVINMTKDNVWPNTLSKCAPQGRFTSSPGKGEWVQQGPGVGFLQVWGGGMTGPGAKADGPSGTAQGTTNVDGLTVAGGQAAQAEGTWELLSGFMYKLDKNQNGQVVPFDITPRYEGRPLQ